MESSAIVEGIKQRNVAALARAISLVENGRNGYETVLSALHPLVGRAHRIGITGPPGGGKSTLIERLAAAYRKRDVTVAVVAVDPTSPFTGGALLGDRIRMESLALDPGVFIRSMASRGAQGGLATTTREVCDVLDAYGFGRIIVETVGVGQSELSIAGSADTTVLVLVPESGDGVQVLKAGVMEIADVYVVNKADRPGADRLAQEVEIMLGIRRGNAYLHVAAHHDPGAATSPSATGGRNATDHVPVPTRPPVRPSAQGSHTEGEPGAWSPPVLRTTAKDGTGVDSLVDAVEAHHVFLEGAGGLAALRRERLARHTRDVVDRAVRTWVWEDRDGEGTLARSLDALATGRVSPYQLAHDLVSRLREGSDDD
jgi:LAO/AO transport system kinase